MSVESFRVAATLGLNVRDTLAPLAEVLKAYRDVLSAQKAIVAAQAEINAALKTSTAAARGFADQMERAARAARDMAAAGSGRSSGGYQPGAAPFTGQTYNGTASPAPTPGTALVPAPRLLPAPVTEFQTQGAPYIPGALVPTGDGRTWTEATGARPGERSAVVPYQGYGVTTRNGFTMPGGGPADEPFFPPGGGPPIPLYGRPSREDWYALGYGAQAVGGAAGGMVDSSFMAAATVQQLQGALKTQGFTDKQASDALDAAMKTQRDVKGAYVGQSMEILVSLMKQTQNADEAITLLEPTVRAQTVFKGLGRGDGVADVNAMLNSAELRSVILKSDGHGGEVVDEKAYESYIKNIETITAMSGGQIGPAQMYQFMRSGGVAAKMLTDKNGFAEDMPFIQSMGAAQAGTALQGFSQQFSGGKMSDAALKLMVNMGMIHENIPGGKQNYSKSGIGTWQLLPGAMDPGMLELAQTNPAKFIVDVLKPKIDEYLSKNYGDAFTKGDAATRQGYEFSIAQQIASRIPGGKELAQAISLEPYVNRDVLARAKLANEDPYNTAVDANPLMGLEQFRASINAMQITLGQDNMKVSLATMKALTIALNAMTDVFKSYPALGAEMMMVANALKILAPVIAVLAIGVPAIKGFQTVSGWANSALGAAGGEAGGAAAGVAARALGGLMRFVEPIAAGIFLWNDVSSQIKNTKTAWHTLVEDWNKGDWLGFHPFGKSESPPVNVTLNNTVNVDGKEVSKTTTKHIVAATTGPDNGSGSYDQRRTPPAPGNN